MLLTDEYKTIIEKYHKVNKLWGNGPRAYIPALGKFIYENKVVDLLDYGCGKAKNLQFIFDCVKESYDPGVPEYSNDPKVCEHLICMDVLEHIEPNCIGNVLNHINSKFTKKALLSISLLPARDVLPDGRNAHILIKPAEWWVKTLSEHLTLESILFSKGNLLVLVTPK
jgi:hypothetical protein